MTTNSYQKFDEYSAKISYLSDSFVGKFYGGCITSMTNFIYTVIDGREYRIYDINKDEWLIGGSLNYRRGSPGCAIYDDTLYVFGGDEYSQGSSMTIWDHANMLYHVPNESGTIESHSIRINKKNDDWTIISWEFGWRERHSCITVYDYIYCIGGRTNDNIAANSVTVFDCRVNKLMNSSHIKLNVGRVDFGVDIYKFDDNNDNQTSLIVYGGRYG
eukprot:180708_1